MSSTSIKVNLGERTYEILIGSGIIRESAEKIKKILSLKKLNRITVITDKNLEKLYLQQLVKNLESSGYSVSSITLSPGEETKNFDTIKAVSEQLVGFGMDRKSFIVALGGGVVGDIAGFVAAIYMRGIPYVQLPTTLLAQVDSSVGGKTGVNLDAGKNLVGAFWQPTLVIADIKTLDTLSERDFNEGIAEVVKYGVIWDKEFFSWLENNVTAIKTRDYDALSHIVSTSCEIKGRVVEADERESGLRAILNYGHTFAHAIETATGYSHLRHGEAVSIGMVAAARAAARLGFISAGESEKIESLLTRFELPVRLSQPIDTKDIMSAFAADKKASAGRAVFILPEKIGKVFRTSELSTELVKSILNELIA